MEKGITAWHCPALIPPFYYHLTPFSGGPPLPILLRTHNLLSTSLLRQREICYSAQVKRVGGLDVGWGDKYGGVGCFGGRPAVF